MGNWVLEKVREEIGDLYPPIPDPNATPLEIASDPQLAMEFAPKRQMKLTAPGGFLTPVAYLWTRTVTCKNPACGATVPLVKQTWLCKKKGRYIALRIVAPPGEKRVRFEVVESETEGGLGFDPSAGSTGGNATCPFCGTVVGAAYVQECGKRKTVKMDLMAVVSIDPNTKRKTYTASSNLSVDHLPDSDVIQARIEKIQRAAGITRPDEKIGSMRPSPNARGLSGLTRHGLYSFGDLFTQRQIACLLTFCETVSSAVREMTSGRRIVEDRAIAVATMLALAVDKLASRSNTFCPFDSSRETVILAFGRQALPMIWDFAEASPLESGSGSFRETISNIVDNIEVISASATMQAIVERGTASALPCPSESVDAIVTDPPYYDNVPYADISDFFYVWLKRSIQRLYPDHFASELTPKKSEATTLASRHGGNMSLATAEYESTMLECFREGHRVLKPAGQMVVVYAHKTTLGWSTLVDVLRLSGFTVTEAWPLNTEYSGHLKTGTASLASSIFLVARKRNSSSIGSYEDEVRPELEEIVRERVDTLWRMGVSGADLVIAAVGAGLRAFTRFSRVEYANGEEVPAEKFLAEVEGVVLETLLEKIFGVGGSGVAAVDGPSRFYVLWRYTFKAAEMDAGEAIVFTYGQNVELDGPKGLSSGRYALVEKKKGKYRLRDFSERGNEERLGQPTENGNAASLIDVLHRILWLLENEPRNLNAFLDEVRPDRERLRLVAQALAGTALSGSREESQEHVVTTTPAEQAALRKLVGNWRTLIDQRLAGTLFEMGRK